MIKCCFANLSPNKVKKKKKMLFTLGLFNQYLNMGLISGTQTPKDY